MKVFLGLMVIGLACTACEKDKFQTKPQIEIESVSGDVVPVGGSLQVGMRFTDKEGDVDDSVFMIRERVNARDVSPGKVRTLPFNIAAFPNKPSGDMDVTLDYLLLTFGNSTIPLPGSVNEADTLLLRFFVRDAAQNVSDTVTLNQNIVVIR